MALTDIKQHRERRNMSAQELADRCKISRQMVFQIESGNRRPSVETLLRISSALDVTVGELLKNETLKD